MVGSVPVGGDAPISIQSMTTTKTADVEGTLAQIYALAAAGCDIVRCTCNEEEAAEGLAQIVPRSPVPLVADIHFQHKLALAAMEAGVQALRLNPGNIRKADHIKLVAKEAKDRGLPIRIGVNAGSLDPAMAEQHGGITPEALVASAMHELDLFREVGFDDVKISVKASSVPLMIDSYRLLADTTDHPLHLGVTEAGPPPAGLVKSVAGIGDPARRGHRRHDPVLAHRRSGRRGQSRSHAARGARAARTEGPRPHRVPVVRSRRSGRHQRRVRPRRRALEERNIPLQVAVMGCVVNGPGEAREADLGIAAGRGKGHLFVKGKVVRVVPEAEMVDALVEEAERIMAEGIEARLAAADDDAEAIAAAAREELLQIQGTDVNHASEKIARIREHRGVARAAASDRRRGHRARLAGRRHCRRRGAAR